MAGWAGTPRPPPQAILGWVGLCAEGAENFFAIFRCGGWAGGWLGRVDPPAPFGLGQCWIGGSAGNPVVGVSQITPPPLPQETTTPAATMTPLRMDPPPPPHPRDYPFCSANAATTLTPTPTPTMAERAHPCNYNRGQPRTAKDSPEKTPGAPPTLGDEPTDTLQERGGEAADSALSPTAGTRTKGN